MNFSEIGEDFLAHYGVKGMKWGVRRGKSNGGRRKGEKVNPKALSDAELKQRVDRLRLEDQFLNLQKSTSTTEGKKFADELLKQSGKIATSAVIGGVASFTVQRYLKSKFPDTNK